MQVRGGYDVQEFKYNPTNLLMLLHNNVKLSIFSNVYSSSAKRDVHSFLTSQVFSTFDCISLIQTLCQVMFMVMTMMKILVEIFFKFFIMSSLKKNKMLMQKKFLQFFFKLLTTDVPWAVQHVERGFCLNMWICKHPMAIYSKGPILKEVFK